jgi:hypothetical protein
MLRAPFAPRSSACVRAFRACVRAWGCSPDVHRLSVSARFPGPRVVYTVSTECVCGLLRLSALRNLTKRTVRNESVIAHHLRPRPFARTRRACARARHKLSDREGSSCLPRQAFERAKVSHKRAEMPYMSAEMRGLSGGNHLRSGIVPESQPYRGLTPRERAGHLSPGPSLLSRPGSATNSPRLPRQQPAPAFTASMRGLRIPEPLPQRGLTADERANPTQACRGPSLLYRDRFGQSSSAGGPGVETRRGFEAKMVLPLPELPFAAVRALPAKYASQLRTVLIQPR